MSIETTKTLLKLLKVITIIAIVIISVMFGHLVKAQFQMEIYKALITVSAIIFGIMGAWLSLLKVEIISGIESAKSDEEALKYTNKARNLVSPMTASAIVLVSSLVFVFAYYLLINFSLSVSAVSILRAASFLILSLLAFWQIASLLTVMFSGIDFIIDISRKSKSLSADRKR